MVEVIRLASCLSAHRTSEIFGGERQCTQRCIYLQACVVQGWAGHRVSGEIDWIPTDGAGLPAIKRVEPRHVIFVQTEVIDIRVGKDARGSRGLRKWYEATSTVSERKNTGAWVLTLSGATTG